MMERWISLLEAEYCPYLLGAIALVWMLLLGRLLRSQASWKAVRCLLLTLALGCLLLVGLRPAYLEEEASVDVLYLTENFQKRTKDSLLAVYPKARVFATNSQAKVAQIDIPQLLKEVPPLASIHVLGDGLSGYELDFLSDREIYFYLNEYPEGIQKLAYNQVFQAGMPLVVRLDYHKKKEGTTTIKLVGPSGELAKKALDKTGDHSLEFEIEKQVAGRFLYEVQAENDGVFIKETFPVYIRPAADYRLLVLQSAPFFETKYLKNLLASEGRELAIRTTISKDKYKTEFINRTPVKLEKITSNLLGKFEVLVLDELLLSSLSKQELTALDAAIKSGLGLLILGTNDAARYSVYGGFSISPTGKKKAVLWQENTVKKDEIISVDVKSNAIRTTAGTHPLLTAKDGRLLAAYRMKGAGRIAFSLLSESYKLQLTGSKKAYRQLWTTLLDGCLAPDWLANDWLVDDPLAVFVEERLEVGLITEEVLPEVGFQKELTPDPSLAKRGGTSLAGQLPVNGGVVSCPAAQALYLPEQWSSFAWPREVGWHFFATKKYPEERKWVFVQEEGAWDCLLRSRRILLNRQWEMVQDRTSFKAPLLAKNRLWVLPLWWLYVGFLVFVGGIWLLEKLD